MRRRSSSLRNWNVFEARNPFFVQIFTSHSRCLTGFEGCREAAALESDLNWILSWRMRRKVFCCFELRKLTLPTFKFLLTKRDFSLIFKKSKLFLYSCESTSEQSHLRLIAERGFSHFPFLENSSSVIPICSEWEDFLLTPVRECLMSNLHSGPTPKRLKP